MMDHGIWPKPLWRVGIVEKAKLRAVVAISCEQSGFMPGRSTKDAIFGARMLIEKCRQSQKEFDRAFIDLEKSFDRLPKYELCHCT